MGLLGFIELELESVDLLGSFFEELLIFLFVFGKRFG
jgi:hypothetical protein